MQSNDSLVAQWAKANQGYMAQTKRRKLASRLWKRIRARVKAGTLKLEDYHTVTPEPKPKPSLRALLKGDA
jgi:hypothetical protein